MFRTCAVRFVAIWLTVSVRSFQTPETPLTCAWPPSLPSVPTSRATRVTSSANERELVDHRVHGRADAAELAADRLARRSRAPSSARGRPRATASSTRRDLDASAATRLSISELTASTVSRPVARRVLRPSPARSCGPRDPLTLLTRTSSFVSPLAPSPPSSLNAAADARPRCRSSAQSSGEVPVAGPRGARERGEQRSAGPSS